MTQHSLFDTFTLTLPPEWTSIDDGQIVPDNQCVFQGSCNQSLIVELVELTQEKEPAVYCFEDMAECAGAKHHVTLSTTVASERFGQVPYVQGTQQTVSKANETEDHTLTVAVIALVKHQMSIIVSLKGNGL